MSLTIQLPLAIKSREEAVAYLTMLHETGYAYHCDDSVYDGTPEGSILWGNIPPIYWPTVSQQIHMDKLMEQVFKYHDDPCQVLCDLDGLSGWTVQKLIDELMKVKDKTLPISIFDLAGGIGGELSDIDESIEVGVELNVRFF
jgi:hypothetical protein